MKKLLSMLLVLVMALGVCSLTTACSNDDKDEFKIGLICLHDDNSTYDKNFIDSMYAALDELGLSKEKNLVLATGIDEKDVCYETAADMVDEGCDIVFADSFGHEGFLLKAAREFTNVEFCHATGTMAHTENLANFHNAFASIYEGRYLAGIAGGMKLKALIEADALTANNYDSGVKGEGNVKIGYIGAYTYAEVISGYTSYYLGVKSVVPNVVMDVTFTGSWYSEKDEKAGAELLISNGCALISQHADSKGAPTACETAGIPNVSYNGSTASFCPKTFVVSSRIDWAPYFKYIINAVKDGDPATKIATDWTGTIENGSVVLTELGGGSVAGTQEAIDAAKAKILNKTLKIFDTTTFKVTIVPDDPSTDAFDGINCNATVDADGYLTGYTADVNTDPNYAGDTQVVVNGMFDESAYRSAPYFDIQIDGIRLLNAKF